MDCPSCQERNPDDARFCERCGAPLALRCAACGREVRAGARFCSGCGRALEAGPAAEPAPGAIALPEREGGERRPLTVLFCDLVRSTELAARLDPEDWGEALAAYQKAADAVVARYGGHVAQHLGDGLLAYFGWPRALDDAAERAVRAGLALIEAAAGVAVEGQALAARVGVHTGTVVVGALGEGMSAETLALGQVPNVAARVQSAAEPGSVLLTAETQRLVAGLFVVEERGGRELPGLPEPMALYRAVQASGVRGRIHAAAAARRLTTFVGREQERQLLRERFELAEEGEGQVVLITGEPGIGKSRLVAQLKEELGSTPHTWVEAAGSPYLQHTPFAPVAELLGQGFRFPVELPMAERVAAVERVLAAMGLVPANAVPLLAPLLGLTLPERYPPLLVGPEEQRRRLLATIVAWTLASARLQPTVVVMEDLHWMDASTLELEGLLVDQVATARLLLILTARPEFRAPWPLRAHHAQLSLARLSRRQTRELIGAVASRALAKSDLVEALVARTDGVPLFVEELARAVVESGEAIAPRDIPATLQDTLMARLDRLGDAKAVAQVGAVLGREFGFAELLAVASLPAEELESALVRLCGAELLHARGFGAEASYVFKHALVQQAAYESLLKSRRRDLHRRAAEVLARAADTPPALLAQHWESAGEAAMAVAAWQAAAEQARRSAASFEAAEHFRRALAVVATLPESPERDRQELALQYPLSSYLVIAQGTESPELHTARARARELALRVGDATMTVSVLSAFWAEALVRGEYRTALAIAEQMLGIAEREGALRPRVVAHADKAMCHYNLGELAAAREHSERVLELYDEDALRDDPLDRRVLALSVLAHSAVLMGRMGEARRREAELLAAARSRGVVTDLALAEAQVLFGSGLRREPEGVVERGRELVALCAEHELELFRGSVELYLGWATACLGDGEEGVALVREGHRRLLATGNLGARSLGLLFLAEALAAAGLRSEALATLEDAYAAIGENEVRRPDLLRLRGDLLAEQGDDLAAAEAAYREAIERARVMQALLIEVRAATGLARLLQRRGRSAQARELLAPVYALFTDGLDSRDGREAKATLDALGVSGAR
jgi:class 3 adenylate cyclase/tetratricopeptide (TPR) repeat protein